MSLKVEKEGLECCTNCCAYFNKKEDEITTKKIESSLQTIYKLNFLHKLNFDSLIWNEEPINLCQDCTNIFLKVNLFYEQFNHRRHVESYLEMSINILDEIIQQLYSHINQEQKEEEEPQQEVEVEVKLISHTRSSSTSLQQDNGPWVTLCRLTSQEIKAHQTPHQVDDDLNKNSNLQEGMDEGQVDDVDYDPGQEVYFDSDHCANDDADIDDEPPPTKIKKSRNKKRKNESCRRKSLKEPEKKIDLTCPLCLINYESSMELNDHFRSNHFPTETLACPICSTSTVNQHSLRNHLRGHAGLRTFTCPKSSCSKIYKYKSDLKRHLIDMHGNKITARKYKCKICSIPFESKPPFTKHMKTHRPHVCHCGKGFSSGYDLSLHKLNHEKEAGKLVHCPKCKKRYTKLDEHMLTCNKEAFLCSFPNCGKVFAFSSTLQTHEQIHTDQRNHLCPTCGKRFRDIGVLKRHILLHTGERPHACHLCPKTFVQSGALKAHLIFHSGQKLFLCTNCGMSLTTRTGLKRHMQVHTGVLPHICTICDARFPDRRPLLKHLKTHETKPEAEDKEST